MARRTKEDAGKTRETLLESAENLFLEKGFAATSLEDIARHAGVTRGAVYWHFENKQALFDTMHERVCLPLEQDYQQVLLAPHISHAIYQHCLYALEYVTGNERVRNIMTILLLRCESIGAGQSNVERINRERAEIIAKFTEGFSKARANGELDRSIDPETAAIALHALMHGLFHDCISSENPRHIMANAPAILGIFFGGLGVRHPLAKVKS